jgi:hypothetical protein
MKNHKIHIVSLIFLLTVISFACEKDDDWQQISALSPDAGIAAQLDAIVSEDNDCLLMTSDARQIKAIFASGNFTSVDNCNDTPDIDFSNSTLVVGKIEILSISDEIGSVSLSKLNTTYRIDVVLERCSECEQGTGFAYFWKLYPKMELGSKLELFVE